ncbi:hypothetical protein [Rhizobium sp.]|uniref:hypothetical protein n=1 Tax=Rhizobium sp. TaxID=391 RepID=UPI003F7F2053
MKRRSLLASLCALPLASCQGESATVRFKVIASATVDGRPIESSSVMEISYSKVTRSLIGTGGATRLYGEALIFDLGGKGTIYILPVEHPPQASLDRVYEYAILSTFGIRNGFGSLSESDFNVLRSASGRRPFNLRRTSRLPAFVGFTDEANPKTIYEIDPWKIGERFAGVRFSGLEIEITSERVTGKLRERLPWLSKSEQVFNRDPPGEHRPESERPIGYLLTRANFFGDGSR